MYTFIILLQLATLLIPASALTGASEPVVTDTKSFSTASSIGALSMVTNVEDLQTMLADFTTDSSSSEEGNTAETSQATETIETVETGIARKINSSQPPGLTVYSVLTTEAEPTASAASESSSGLPTTLLTLEPIQSQTTQTVGNSTRTENAACGSNSRVYSCLAAGFAMFALVVC